MSDILYFIIILIGSPTEVNVIYNKVSVAEYKKFETGTIARQSYANSIQGLEVIEKDSEKFKEGNSTQEMFINQAGDKSGFMGALGIKITQADVEAYAKAKNLGPVTDKVVVAFTHDKLVKNIAR